MNSASELTEFLIVTIPEAQHNAVPEDTTEWNSLNNNLVQTVNNGRITTPPETEYKYWTIDHSKMLIELYGVYKKKVGSFKVKNLKKMWEIIAEKLRDIYNINVSPNNVENRWRVLERNYKKYIDNNKQTGGGRKIFAYAEDMEGVLGKKKNIRPEILLSSTTVDVPKQISPVLSPDLGTEVTDSTTRENEEGEELKSTLCQNVLSKTPIRRNKLLDNRNSILQGLRKDRKEYQEKRVKIEEEKLEVMREKVKEIRRRNELLTERNEILKSLKRNEAVSVEDMY